MVRGSYIVIFAKSMCLLRLKATYVALAGNYFFVEVQNTYN